MRWEVDGKKYTRPELWGGVNRGSVRVHSKEVYDVGKMERSEAVLITIDVEHIPTGVSLWPAFWTTFTGANIPPRAGTNPVWPTFGEIDIIETWNDDTTIQSTLHTTGETWSKANSHLATNQTRSKCSMSGVDRGKHPQTGAPADGSGNCDVAATGNAGCGVTGPADTHGRAFNDQKGGVFAMEWSVLGEAADAHIAMWYWPREEWTRQGGADKMFGSSPDPAVSPTLSLIPAPRSPGLRASKVSG